MTWPALRWASSWPRCWDANPREPFYLRHVDRDLSHYNAVANEIEYPDVEANRLADVSGANRPFSLTNNNPQEIWNLTLEQAMQIALTNNRVMRTIGGQVQGPPEFLLRNPSWSPRFTIPPWPRATRTRAWKRPCRPSIRSSAAV